MRYPKTPEEQHVQQQVSRLSANCTGIRPCASWYPKAVYNPAQPSPSFQDAISEQNDGGSILLDSLNIMKSNTTNVVDAIERLQTTSDNIKTAVSGISI